MAGVLFVGVLGALAFFYFRRKNNSGFNRLPGHSGRGDGPLPLGKYASVPRAGSPDYSYDDESMYSNQQRHSPSNNPDDNPMPQVAATYASRPTSIHSQGGYSPTHTAPPPVKLYEYVFSSLSTACVNDSRSCR